MADKLQQIVERMVAAGESEADIASVIQHHKATTAQAAPQAEPGFLDRMLADNPALPPMFRGGQAVMRFAKRNPVEAAAMVGGTLAAPLSGGASIPAAMAAAGLGAAGGAGAAIAGRQLITGTPEKASDTLTTMAKQGAMGAAGEGVGQGIVRGANIVIPKILKHILRPGKTVQQEFSDVVDVMRHERIPIGQSEVAQGRMSASAAQADDVIKQAEAAGVGLVSPRGVVQEMRDVTTVTKQRAKLGKPDETGDVAARAKALYAKNKSGIPLTEAQALKRRAQTDSQTVFRAIDRGHAVNDTGALTDKAVATGLRKGIEARVPAVAPINERTQQLIGLTRALEDAEARSGGGMGWNPVNVIGGMMPGLSSRVAFGADAAAQAVQGPTAQMLRRALLAALAGDEQKKQ